MELATIVLNSSIYIDLQEKIGEGSFGLVRRGIVRDMGENVAVKLEAEKNSRKGELLLNEANVLRDLQGSKGVPTFYYFGVQDDYHFVVQQLLGSSLHTRLRECRRKLSLHTTLMLVDQMLTVIEAVHSAGYVYRDVKPHNFLFGLGKRAQELFLIDYGLAKKLSQYPVSRGTVMCTGYSGTLPFISMNAHLGVKAARRDDLESIGYLAVYLQTGKLPWYTPGAEVSERETRIAKQEFANYLQSQDLPEEFKELITYARGLKFDETPDYALLRSKFRGLAERHCLPYNWVYDWDALERQPTVERKHRRRHQSTSTLGVEEDTAIRTSGSTSSISVAPISRRGSKSASRTVTEKQQRGKKRKRTLVMRFCGFQNREEVKGKIALLKDTLGKMKETQETKKEEVKKESCVVC